MHFIATHVVLADVEGQPFFRKDLPAPMRLGDTLRLEARLLRKHNRRTEELRLQGEFKIVEVAFDGHARTRQVLKIEAKGLSPSWRAIRNGPLEVSKLGPARAPKTVVE